MKGNGTAGRKPCAECSSGTPPACASLGRSGCAASGPRCEWGGGKCEPAPALPPWTPPAQLPPKWNMSGMTFTGGRYCPNVTMGGTASQQSLAHLASTGANCALPCRRRRPALCVLRALLWLRAGVAIVVTQYQFHINSTEILPLYDPTQVLDTTSEYYT